MIRYEILSGNPPDIKVMTDNADGEMTGFLNELNDSGHLSGESDTRDSFDTAIQTPDGYEFTIYGSEAESLAPYFYPVDKGTLQDLVVQMKQEKPND